MVPAGIEIPAEAVHAHDAGEHRPRSAGAASVSAGRSKNHRRMPAASVTEEQQLILRTVREFVEREVIPVASAMEHRGEYPFELANQMAAMGLFGLNIPEEFGGTEVDYVTFARIFAELSRGWLGLAGIIGTHLVLADVLCRF